MAKHARSPGGDATAAFVSWLVTGAVGPALAALPVNLVADKLAGSAVRWFKRFRQTDDLSRLVKAAAGTSVQLSRGEASNLRKLLEKEQTWSLLAGGELNEKVHELTGQIADCLLARDGRTAQDAREAAGAILRGLLEFAVFVRGGRVVLVVVRPAGRAVPGGSGFLVCADAGGPVRAGAGFGDVAAKVSLPAPAAQSRGSVRALVRLAAAGPQAASRTGREADETVTYPACAVAPGAGAGSGVRQCATPSMTAVSRMSGTAAACRVVR